MLQDGSDARCSGWGVYVNGKKVIRAMKVPLNKPFKLTLAGASGDEDGVICYDCEPWTCSADMSRSCKLDCKHGGRELSCLILKRNKHVPEPETFVIVWGCCRVEMVNPELAGLIVWQQDGVLAYATTRDKGWLKPGMNIDVGGQSLSVKE